MKHRNPPWNREELILALELYFRIGPGRFSSETPEIIELSEILNKLKYHASCPDPVHYRNPNGVNMKLCNFLRFDRSYQGKGFTHGSKLDESIWKEFSENQEQLKLEADRLRRKALLN